MIEFVKKDVWFAIYTEHISCLYKRNVADPVRFSQHYPNNITILYNGDGTQIFFANGIPSESCEVKLPNLVKVLYYR